MSYLVSDRVVFTAGIAGVNVDTNIGETPEILQLSPDILRCEHQVLKILYL